MTWGTIRGVSLPLLACLLLVGCASSPEDASQRPDLAKGMIEGSKAMGQAVVGGAEAIGHGMGTAYHGISNGFQEPSDAAYGPPPRGYVDKVKKYFFRVLRYPEDTRFTFGRPVKGYMNQGLLRGGGVAWEGWLVDVDVETVQGLTGHRADRSYVVRMRNGEIIEVHKDATLLRRVGQPPAKVKRR